MHIKLEVPYNFLSVFLSLYTQGTKTINSCSHTHTNARASLTLPIGIYEVVLISP